MAPIKNLIGKQFGRLTVTGIKDERQNGHTVYECICTCNNRLDVKRPGLISGNTRSCGCLRREVVSSKNMKHGDSARGQTTALYRIWQGIKKRCYDKNFEFYSDYGGRGIEMQRDWITSFPAFKEYVYSLPGCPANAKKSTVRLLKEIDRDDNNADYRKGNLKWSTRREQSNNRRNTITVNFEGVDLPLTIAVEKHGVVSYQCVHRRLKKGWSVESALKTRLQRKPIKPAFRFSQSYIHNTLPLRIGVAG